jgi:valyl-tRNA synthetase
MSDALMSTYKLIWDDYCSWFLEMVKPAYGQPIDAKTYKAVIEILEDNLKILHPFMPFVTEEIWQEITERKASEALIIAKWPELKDYNEEIISEFALASEVIAGIRKIRKEKNILFKNTIDLMVMNNEKASELFDPVILKMGNIDAFSYVDKQVEGALSFRVKSNEYFIPIAGSIDVEAEIEKLEEELKYNEGFLKSVEKKLSNERFVNNAPEKVVAIEKAKKADAEAKIEAIKASLKSLK